MYHRYPPIPEHVSNRANKQRKKRAVIIVCIVLAACLVLFATKSLAALTSASSKNTSVADTTTQAKQSTAAVPSAAITQLEASWKTIAASRAGDIDIAVYNNATGETAHFTNAAGTLNTASIIKIAIAEALLTNVQNEDRTLTDEETAQMTAMLEQSDNDAASALWEEVGGATAMNAFFATIGATATIAGTDGHWGLTQTSSTDQLKILNVFAYPGDLLTNASANIIDDMLDNVETSQTWGVSSGLTGSADFKLKNGWLQDAYTTDAYASMASWTMNSIGHITDDGVDYTIAVLTDGQTDEAYGIETIELLSSATWSALSS